MKIGIMGTPISSGNRGVLALGSSLVNLICETSSAADPVLFIANRSGEPVPFRVRGKTRSVPVVNYRLSPSSRIRSHLIWILLMSLLYRLLPVEKFRAFLRRNIPWIGSVSETAFIGDIRGGDSFSDIYGLRRFCISFLSIWSVLLIKGTMIQFPQTYGPYRSSISRLLARYILKRSAVIIARDKESREVARKLLNNKKEILLSPDVAFSLEAVNTGKPELTPPLSDTSAQNVIGLNVNGLMYHGGYTRQNMFNLKLDYAKFLQSLVVELMKEHNGEIWLVPHTFEASGRVESDPESSLNLLDTVPDLYRPRIRIISRNYDQYEIKGIIGQCDFFIGSRMHACIAALSQGIPCVGVAYSMKFQGVFDSVGMGEWVVDGRYTQKDSAVARIIDLYRIRNTIRETLSENAQAAREQLKKMFGEIIFAVES